MVLVVRPAVSQRRLPTDATPADDQRITKTGWFFEVQRPVEVLALATMNSEIAWAFGPVDDDSVALTDKDAIEHDGRLYEMQGPAVIEKGVDGEAVQVWCTVKWEAG